MKVVQIGCAGHAFYAHGKIAEQGFDFAAISCGTHGIEAEGIDRARNNLINSGFSPKLYSDYKEMIRVEKPDIAIVNPWFNDNGKVALFALEQGVNVFCEKPIATDFETLERIEAAAIDNGVILSGMFESRYMPEFITVKNAIDSGWIGRVRMMDSRKSYKLGKRPEFYSSRETYCGILPWVAIHAIDWMAWLSGEKYTDVTACHSTAFNGGNGDMDITSAAQFMMTNDVIATLTADMYRPASSKTHGDDRVRVVGTKGVVEAMHGRVTLISDDCNGAPTDGEIELPLASAGSIFEDFLAQLRGEKNHLDLKSAIEASRWALKADEYARLRSPLGAV